MSSFYIAAAHKSSGKTTLSIGLTRALARRGLDVRCFKKGPDYIDPMWLAHASGQACHNLDFFTASEAYNLEQFASLAQGNDVAMVEGNMGLFDGISLDGSDSNAAMAKLLQLPVLFVVDCAGTSRGIAPLLQGYARFDPELRFAGVILNKVAGGRHERKLRSMVEQYTDMQVMGAIHRNPELTLEERHLGLTPSNEVGSDAERTIERLADIIDQSTDIDKIIALPDSPLLKQPPQTHPRPQCSQPRANLRIAYARDEAFGFYYPDDLQRFVELGAELVALDCCNDAALPENIDGLFIGGGFPESRVDQLSVNQPLLKDIRQAIENGLPTYAECGGLMYLCQELVVGNTSFPLCGVIPATVTMNARPQGRGYVVLEAKQEHPWIARGAEPKPIQAHEFHYSSLSELPPDTRYAYTIRRGTGIDGVNDGILMYNLLASYVHLRQTDTCRWVDQFISFVNQCKRPTKS